MKLGLFHYQLLYQILERIHYIYDEDQLANEVLENISAALNAEGGTIFKLLPDGKLYPLASYGVPIQKLRELTFETGRGVAGWVVQYGQPVKVDKPMQDPRFVGKIDAVTGFKTTSILAAPILAKGKTIGVIEFLNRREGPFNFPDMELIGMVGREVGIAFENVALVKEITHTRAFLDALADSLSAGIVVVDGSEQLLKMNPSAQQIFGLSLKEADWLHQPAGRIFNDYPKFLNAIRVAMQSPTALVRQQITMNINDRPRVIGYSGTVVTTPDKQRLGTAILFQDITAYVPAPPR